MRAITSEPETAQALAPCDDAAVGCTMRALKPAPYRADSGGASKRAPTTPLSPCARPPCAWQFAAVSTAGIGNLKKGEQFVVGETLCAVASASATAAALGKLRDSELRKRRVHICHLTFSQMGLYMYKG
eukprot:SAG11_NODE_171_length_13596_cov_15.767356_11_plen_129_part_00